MIRSRHLARVAKVLLTSPPGPIRSRDLEHRAQVPSVVLNGHLERMRASGWVNAESRADQCELTDEGRKQLADMFGFGKEIGL